MNLDHIIITVPDLDSMMKDIQEKLGCQLVYGGKHPDLGTHNAILGIKNPLGLKQYIEFLAIDPEAYDPQKHYPFDLNASKTEPKVVAWIARCSEIEKTVEKMKKFGENYHLKNIKKATRKRPDGAEISCKLAFNPEQMETSVGVIPFLIETPDDIHPVNDLSDQNFCDQCLFELKHPLGAEITKNLKSLGLDDPIVRVAPEASLLVKIISNNKKWFFN